MYINHNISDNFLQLLQPFYSVIQYHRSQFCVVKRTILIHPETKQFPSMETTVDTAKKPIVDLPTILLLSRFRYRFHDSVAFCESLQRSGSSTFSGSILSRTRLTSSCRPSNKYRRNSCASCCL